MAADQRSGPGLTGGPRDPLSGWVSRMAGFLERVEAKLRTYEVGTRSEPIADLREVRAEAARLRSELDDSRQRGTDRRPDSHSRPRWVVRVDLDLVRRRLSEADRRTYSDDDVRH